MNLLQAQGYPVRIGSRSGDPAFDWHDPSTWRELIDGASAIYISYHPDLASPGAPEAIQRLIDISHECKVRKLVLLSGRGEEEAQRCEAHVMNSEIPSTVVRCAWFNQNFDESFLQGMVVSGKISLPVKHIREPFVDVDDIAEVAVSALTQPGHEGEIYELTGPELLSFPEVAAQLSTVLGREIYFQSIPRSEFLSNLQITGLPKEFTNLLDYLFTVVLDGRNEFLGDGVQRALGRPPRPFVAYAKQTAEAGHWNTDPNATE
ncbi:MAG: NmrA family NAD(P)-binding protein [Verrucomicrobiales bacterium]